MHAPEAPILSPGRNCERVERARRVAWLVDGERYFDALAAAIERARRSVLLVGWDFHSRVRLRRDGRDEELVALLERVVKRRRGLHVRMLGWDFAMIYALEREFLPLQRFERQTHRRIQFRLDDRHPPGASHHQKLVVIDDAIAFSGGLDVTVCRWDSPAHEADDPRRSDPGFESYGPFHDVQILVDGDAARALGEIARERWQRATGHRLRAREVRGDPWPDGLAPDLRDVRVGIARTQPAWEDQPEIRHVEALHVDAIRAARRSIYLENQYFTASAIRDALAERLREDDPPEVVVVVPRTLSGWLEKRTMGALMTRLIDDLREADESGRLGVYVPVLPGDEALTVHSKVSVVDDRLLRIGSANLSNRSLGLDTECDVAVESTPERDVSAGITAFRDALLAEHLGARPEEVQAAVAEHGSLLRAIDALSDGERRLVPFDARVAEFDSDMLPGRALFDPEHPVPFEELRSQLVGSEELLELPVEPSRRGTVARIAAAIAIPVLLIAVWQLTPVAEWVSPRALSDAAGFLEDGIAGRLLGIAVFVAAAVLFVPVVSLIVATALVFGFTEGALLALAGSTAAAAAGYGLGRLLWRDTVRRLSGGRLQRLNRYLSRRGLLATAVVRVVPVAPFAVVNLVAGASRVGLQEFVLGTVLGMAPGTVALAFFGESAAELMRSPSSGSLAAMAAAAVVVIGLALIAERFVGRDDGPGPGDVS